MASIAERVVLRHLKAKEFDTERALRQYLKEHPDADPARHTVNKSKREPGKPDAPKVKRPAAPKPPPPAGTKTPPKAPPSKPPPVPKKPPPLPPKGKKPPPLPKKPQAPAKPAVKPSKPPAEPKQPAGPAQTQKPGRFEAWKSRFKGLSESASKFVEEAPKAVKHFFGDDEFRASTLKEAKSALAKAPKKLVTNLVDTAKQEAKGFKTASAGVKQVMTGKKMSKKQKEAVREVTTHVAIAAAAAAFAASGPLMGAGLFAKGLATHVALKSVKKSLANLHLLEELGHVGHGVAQFISHIASEGGKEPDDTAADEALVKLVMASVAKEIEQLTDEDFAEVLISMGEDDETSAVEKKASERVVARYLALSSIA